MAPQTLVVDIVASLPITRYDIMAETASESLIALAFNIHFVSYCIMFMMLFRA
jgi:hypothetical protein